MKEMPMEQPDMDAAPADDMDQMLDSVAQEMLQAIEKKDHKMLLEALTALVLHIKDQDEAQDEMPMDEEPAQWKQPHN